MHTGTPEGCPFVLDLVRTCLQRTCQKREVSCDTEEARISLFHLRVSSNQDGKKKMEKGEGDAVH